MNITQNIQNKQRVLALFQSINKAIAAQSLTEHTLAPHMSDAIEVQVTKPITTQRGHAQHVEGFWHPILHSFPDMEVVPYLLLGGEYRGMQSVACAGNFVGTFAHPWLGIPANAQSTWIRFHFQCILENNTITRAWFFLDILSVMRQSGHLLFPQQGAEIITNSPHTQDGIVLYHTDEAESKASLALVNEMLNGLLQYDGQTLSSMGQERFWDTERMMWYGPSGIGTARGLKGFQDYHQIPFLTAFPDRGIIPREEQACALQIGDGNYACDFGFPAMYASHTGDGWLGLAKTNKKITMRVTDIWRREGRLLKENWVMIDMIDILEQFGIDVFEMFHGE